MERCRFGHFLCGRCILDAGHRGNHELAPDGVPSEAALITRLRRARSLVLTDHSNDIEIRQTIDDAIAALSGKGPAT